MKKSFIICCLLVLMFFFFGCNTNNDIYNKSYSINLDVVTLQNSLNGVVDKAKHAVLGVTCYKRSLFSEGGYAVDSTGSGAVYSASAILKNGEEVLDITHTKESEDVDYYRYYLVTNYHVIDGGSKICIYDGEDDFEITAQVKGADKVGDLAVLYFEYDKYIEPLMFADSSKVLPGDFIISVGNPYGYTYYSTASFGIVSNTDRLLASDTNKDGVDDYYALFIQHDSPINSGNSGGPVVNIYGEIVGINTQKVVDGDADNMAFAIPSNTVKKVIERLATDTVPKRATLQANVYPVKDITNKSYYGIPQDLDYGLYVEEVSDGYFKNAGLLKGDIILSINENILKNYYNAMVELNKIFVGNGESATVKVYRNGEYIEIVVNF